MPVYPRDGAWVVVIHHRGRRIDRRVDGKKADAEAYEARLRSQLEQGDPVQDPRRVPTFSSFCVETYAPHAELRLKPLTWSKRQHLLANLYEFFGALRLNQIDAAKVDAFAKQRKTDGLSPVTINNELRVLGRVIRFAREERGIPVAEPKWSALPERGTKKVRAWSQDDARRFLEVVAAHSPAILGVMTFLLNTGCRKGEAIALTWENVDTKRGYVRIWPSDEWSPKNDQAREVPISLSLEPWLADDRRKGKWVFPAPDGSRYADFPKRGFNRARRLSATYACVKCSRPRPIVPTGQRRLAAFAATCECGRTKWRETARALAGGPHTLRHTYATAFLSKCPDLFLLGKLMGHSHERVTELYAHLLPDHLARARNVVDLSATAGPAALEAAARWRKP